MHHVHEHVHAARVYVHVRAYTTSRWQSSEGFGIYLLISPSISLPTIVSFFCSSSSLLFPPQSYCSLSSFVPRTETSDDFFSGEANLFCECGMFDRSSSLSPSESRRRSRISLGFLETRQYRVSGLNGPFFCRCCSATDEKQLAEQRQQRMQARCTRRFCQRVLLSIR